MYFKRLELVGFKSFCERTQLDFEPGITAVVGPNGCGKSNIFDSIRWVLGEQSVKELRGSAMEDVIFNGTDAQDGVGMAEVTLTFDNGKRFFSVDAEEVAITRRLFRSGESEYLLNKAPVRLKDILELLMGTGIGAESYSLVQQGKIDLILSSRPEDRRLVFDEASGITKYKSQKREALRKLEDTEQNLLRVTDIITEVKRQIGSLERQANKARKYRELFEELKSKDVQLTALQRCLIANEIDALAARRLALQNDEAQLRARISAAESDIGQKQQDLKKIASDIEELKDKLTAIVNSISKNTDQMRFNEQRILELQSHRAYLEAQRGQLKDRLAQDEEKLAQMRREHESAQQSVCEKTEILKNKEIEFNALSQSVAQDTETIVSLKRKILEFASQIASRKNELNDLTAKQHVYLARGKRLETEKIKVAEEKSRVQESLNAITQDVVKEEGEFKTLADQIASSKAGVDSESVSLANVESDLDGLEKQSLALQSQREFLRTLRTKYEDITQAMNASVYVDDLPQENISGLVIKIKGPIESLSAQGSDGTSAKFKLVGEAKAFDLDASRITEKIDEVQHKIDSLRIIKNVKEAHIQELSGEIVGQQESARQHEISLANKKAQYQGILEQYLKLNSEEEVVELDLSEAKAELDTAAQLIIQARSALQEVEEADRLAEESITNHQNAISANAYVKEAVLVAITQIKTELDAITKRSSDEAQTLTALEQAHAHDLGALGDMDQRLQDAAVKRLGLENEIKFLECGIQEAVNCRQALEIRLRDCNAGHSQYTNELQLIVSAVGADKSQIETITSDMHELDMRFKDLDFKRISLKERVLQSYKFDIETYSGVLPQINQDLLGEEVARLKQKLDAYGSVNLVAIEEYDELKKRYDFLTQQHADLVSAKESLHEAILKINRTTKKMFLETFERVKEEFRHYFKLLFNGGDAQVFLIDEQDPLESGIEIICRPPGKKLQNILLLSGGEKSMSAIALIFAVFKVKPAPFCVLDEIDAALDEANVDRFGKILEEFALTSQFIIITHNKKTIASADVMYGITMAQSGISKIVSVKFSHPKTAPAEARPAASRPSDHLPVEEAA